MNAVSSRRKAAVPDVLSRGTLAASCADADSPAVAYFRESKMTSPHYGKVYRLAGETGTLNRRILEASGPHDTPAMAEERVIATLTRLKANWQQTLFPLENMRIEEAAPWD
jgi:hypothetical protein